MTKTTSEGRADTGSGESAASELEQLKRQLAIRDELFAVATHDLKSPLTALRLQLDTLERTLRKSRGGPVNTERLLAKVENASRQAERLQSLVEHTLDAARLQSGQAFLEREPVELGALMREVADRMAPQLEQAGSTLTVNVAEAVVGLWDRARLEQVLHNLLANAAKFGRGHPIRVDLGRDAGWARLRIHDQGAGIRPEERSAMLAQLQRPGQSGPTGLGLGLYIAYGIVESMGGRLGAEPDRETGSTFVLELPLAS